MEAHTVLPQATMMHPGRPQILIRERPTEAGHRSNDAVNGIDLIDLQSAIAPTGGARLCETLLLRGYRCQLHGLSHGCGVLVRHLAIMNANFSLYDTNYVLLD